MNSSQLASYIDHTNLAADASAADIKKLCAEAREWGFASVCVNSSRAELAACELAGSGVAVCAVVGFPLGAMATAAKACEAREAARAGASEIDMVINIGYIKDGDDAAAQRDIRAVVEVVPQCTVKVIIETCLLTDEEKVRACRAAKSAGAHFVKTSTGFSKAGATVADVKLMRETVGDSMKIKAAGGIRTAEAAMALIEAGADRIGASKSIKICEEVKASSKD